MWPQGSAFYGYALHTYYCTRGSILACFGLCYVHSSLALPSFRGAQAKLRGWSPLSLFSVSLVVPNRGHRFGLQCSFLFSLFSPRRLVYPCPNLAMTRSRSIWLTDLPSIQDDPAYQASKDFRDKLHMSLAQYNRAARLAALPAGSPGTTRDPGALTNSALLLALHFYSFLFLSGLVSFPTGRKKQKMLQSICFFQTVTRGADLAIPSRRKPACRISRVYVAQSAFVIRVGDVLDTGPLRTTRRAAITAIYAPGAVKARCCAIFFNLSPSLCTSPWWRWNGITRCGTRLEARLPCRRRRARAFMQPGAQNAGVVVTVRILSLRLDLDGTFPVCPSFAMYPLHIRISSSHYISSSSPWS